MDDSRLLALSRQIHEQAQVIDQALRDRGLPSPSFDADAPHNLPVDLTAARDSLLDATAELHDLMLSPMELLFHHGAHNNLVCMQAILRFRIPDMFAPPQKVTFAWLAERTGINERLVRRLLKHAATMHIFDCSEPDTVAHTSASNTLRRRVVHDWLNVACAQMWPAATRVVDALVRWPGSDEPGETGYSLALGHGESIYGVIMKEQSLATAFQGAMAAYASQPGMAVSHIVEGYDWAGLGKGGKVVDLGGGRGHVAIPLAQKFPGLTITVQDIPPVIAGAEDGLPPALAGRVSFMPHDMFAEEHLVADAYYLRWVLHNWADTYAAQILRALIPALRPGSKIIIQDIVMPEDSGKETAMWREKQNRAADINMLGIFNSSERSASEWSKLLASADKRFKLERIIQPVASTLAIIEASWTAGD